MNLEIHPEDYKELYTHVIDNYPMEDKYIKFQNITNEYGIRKIMLLPNEWVKIELDVNAPRITKELMGQFKDNIQNNFLKQEDYK